MIQFPEEEKYKWDIVTSDGVVLLMETMGTFATVVDISYGTIKQWYSAPLVF